MAAQPLVQEMEWLEINDLSFFPLARRRHTRVLFDIHRLTFALSLFSRRLPTPNKAFQYFKIQYL